MTPKTEVIRPVAPKNDFRGYTEKPIATQPARNISRSNVVVQTAVTPVVQKSAPVKENPSAFSGAGSGAIERAASLRGAASVQSVRTSGNAVVVSPRAAGAEGKNVNVGGGKENVADSNAGGRRLTGSKIQK